MFDKYELMEKDEKVDDAGAAAGEERHVAANADYEDLTILMAVDTDKGTSKVLYGEPPIDSGKVVDLKDANDAFADTFSMTGGAVGGLRGGDINTDFVSFLNNLRDGDRFVRWTFDCPEGRVESLDITALTVNGEARNPFWKNHWDHGQDETGKWFVRFRMSAGTTPGPTGAKVTLKWTHKDQKKVGEVKLPLWPYDSPDQARDRKMAEVTRGVTKRQLEGTRDVESPAVYAINDNRSRSAKAQTKEARDMAEYDKGLPPVRQFASPTHSPPSTVEETENMQQLVGGGGDAASQVSDIWAD